MAGPTIEFLGHVPDERLPDLLARCRAYVLPGEEDFGIAPVQAQAAGRPVIAYAAGGVLDTVIQGRTGIFFREPTPEALAAAVRSFESSAVDSGACRASASRFAVELFKQKLTQLVEAVVDEDRETA